MSRKLASVQRILEINPIEKADAIEVCKVLGWEVVVAKKDNFKVGDLVVYIEIDSIVPDRPEFEFLRNRKFRIKTIKLRGQVSQGLVMPMSILPIGKYKEGDDITEDLNIKKYDPQADAERKLMEQKLAHTNNKIHKFLSRYPWYRKLIFKPKKSKFPGFIKKTDEDRIQLFPRICEEEKDTLFQITEKLDGQSGTYFLLKTPKKWYQFGKSAYTFGVCSRNLHLPKEDNSSYWTIAKQYNIKGVLESLIGNEQYVVLQGEIIGGNIQKNKYKISGYDFYAFNLIYPNRKMENKQMQELLNPLNIKTVPVLDIGFKLKNTIKDMVEYAKGKSTLLDELREGIVVRNYEKDISFKVVNPDFLLKFGD
ncbi:MAG: RNA ligase family protein [Methanofastidiosum sp.]